MTDEVKNQKDPTINVRELVETSIKRLDDLATVRANAREKYVDDKFNGKDVQYQIQFAAAEKAVGIALVAQEKAVAAALEGTKEAISKADTNTDKRFSLISEKIDGITDTMNKNIGERGVYVTHTDLSQEMSKLRTDFESMLIPIKTMITPIRTFMDSQGGKSEGLNMGWVYLIGAISLVGTILSIFHAVSE